MVLSQVGNEPVPTDVEPSVDATEPEAPEGRGVWTRAWRIGALYWLVCHVAYLSVQFIALRFERIKVAPVRQWKSQLIHNWVQWDGLHYTHIAQFGYPVTKSGYPVWPPGYPVVIRLASYVLPGDVGVAALVVSNVAALGLLVVLYRLIDYELGADSAERTLLMFIAFPTAFFLATAYSESLFLLLTFAALYCARRGYWWAAGLLAGASSGVRVLGAVIVVALAYEYLRQREFNWRRIGFNVLSIALAPLGLLLYMAFLWWRFDNPMEFRDAQAFWGRGQIYMPWTTIEHVLRHVHPIRNPIGGVINLLDLLGFVVGVAFLVLCFVGPWRLRRDQLYLVLAGGPPFVIAVLQPIGIDSEAPMQSMERYVLSFFPMFIVMAQMAKHRFVEKLVLFAALPLQTGLLILFLNGDWAG